MDKIEGQEKTDVASRQHDCICHDKRIPKIECSSYRTTQALEIKNQVVDEEREM